MNALLALLASLCIGQALPAEGLPPFPSAAPSPLGGAERTRETQPTVRHLLLPPQRRVDPKSLPTHPDLRDLKPGALREHASGRVFRSADDLWALFSLKDGKIVIDGEEWDRAAEIPAALQVAGNLCEFRTGENNWIEAWVDGRLLASGPQVLCFSGAELAGAAHLVIRTSCASGSNQGLRLYRIYESDWLAASSREAKEWLPLGSAALRQLNAGPAVFLKRDYECQDEAACQDISLHAAAPVAAAWINGTEIDLNRQGLPAGLLKPGRNSIVVQVAPPVAAGACELLGLEKRQLLRLPQTLEVAAGQAIEVRVEDGAARVLIDGAPRGWALAGQQGVLFSAAPGRHQVVLEWWRCAETLARPSAAVAPAGSSSLRRLDFALEDRCSSTGQPESPWAHLALLRGRALRAATLQLAPEEAALAGISLRFGLPGGPLPASDYRVRVNGQDAPGRGGLHLLAGLLKAGDNRIEIEQVGGAPLPEPALDLLAQAPRLPSLAPESAAASTSSRLALPAGPFVLNLEDVTLSSFGVNGQGALAAAAQGAGLLAARPRLLAWEDSLPDGRPALELGFERLRTWLRLEASGRPITLLLPPPGEEPGFGGVEQAIFLQWLKSRPEGKDAPAADADLEAFARKRGLWEQWLRERREAAIVKLRALIAEECPQAKIE
ncbi:MAG: hypothetical protein RL095_3051 [Verrucomicrobiota bacterium]|jgi:hypothetical protein